MKDTVGEEGLNLMQKELQDTGVLQENGMLRALVITGIERVDATTLYVKVLGLHQLCAFEQFALA